MNQQSGTFEPARTTEPVPAPAQPQPVIPARPASRSGAGRILNVALAIAVALAIGGVAFAAGRLTAPAPAARFGSGGGQFFANGNGNGNANGNRGNGQGGPGAFLAGGGITIQGTVESVTDTTLTLKTASGQTIQVALDGTTTYHAQSSASASDVTSGKTVLVRITGRFRGGGGPGASFAPGNGGTTDQTASDVTVVP